MNLQIPCFHNPFCKGVVLDIEQFDDLVVECVEPKCPDLGGPLMLRRQRERYLRMYRLASNMKLFCTYLDSRIRNAARVD